MKLDVYEVGSVPADVLEAWAKGRQAQDRFSVFTGGYDWFRMMVADKPDEARVVVERNDNGDIRCIVPVQWWNRKVGWRTLRTLKLIGGDCVSVSAGQTNQADVWTSILSRFSDCDALWFGHVLSSRAGNIGGGGFFVHSIFSRMPHYRLILPATLDELWARRSKSSIKKIFGRERALARDRGREVRLVELRSKADVAPYRAAISTLMQGTWQSRELGHGFDGGGVDQLADWGWLRSFVLLLGDEPVAYAHGYQGNGIYVYAQIGYSEDCASYSPGTILLYRLLEHFYSVSDRPLCVDFGEGEADYKQHLANDRQEVSSFMLVRNDAMLRCLFSVIKLASWGRGTLRDSCRRLARRSLPAEKMHEATVPKN